MRHETYEKNQGIRKRVEEITGWFKTTGNLGRTRFKGRNKTQLAEHQVGAAYNLLSMAKLLPSEVTWPMLLGGRAAERIGEGFSQSVMRSRQSRDCETGRMPAPETDFFSGLLDKRSDAVHQRGLNWRGFVPIRREMGNERISRFCEYADLFDRLLDVALLLDLEQFRVLDCNDAAERLFGRSREEIQGIRFLDHVELEARADTERGLRMAKRRYHPRVFQAVLVHPQEPGRKIYVDVSACVLKTRDDVPILQILLRDVTDVHEARLRLEELSVTDELTSLANVRRFKSELAKELDRSRRYRTPFGLLFCDIDYFKNFNDRFGHAAGDAVLREFAARITKCCRTTDLPARYGGEEFVVLCPAVDAQGVSVLAERIRVAMESKPFVLPSGESVTVTVSLGISSFPENGSSSEQLLASADGALYESKRAGRNRWTICSSVIGVQSKKDLSSSSSIHPTPSRRGRKSG